MKRYLRATLIDVGWGDSILVEASDSSGDRPRFMLVDSNDNEKSFRPCITFLKKHFGGREAEFTVEKPFFDAVVLSHDHADHGSGLKRIMREYGTRHFLYPKVDVENSTVVAYLQAYCNHHMVGIPHEHVDRQSPEMVLGDARIKVLWPRKGQIMPDPNNNSVVMTVSLDNVSFLLSGDAEGEVWEQISSEIPKNTAFFKVPHHGSRNGTIYKEGYPWLEELDTHAKKAALGLSCHPTYPNRFEFPHAEVVYEFDQSGYPYYRTDLQYHLTFEHREGESSLRVKYSH
mgnify:CR=1 FL=1